MANTDYKSPDALMRHLRDNGISISGSSQKQQLINTGYFHGYKGYHFFVSSSNRLPFTSYNEINATIQYDTKLKSLLYGKMMFIETALKNIALNTIMSEIDSSSIYDMYDKAISSYKNAPAGTREDIKKKYQNNKLNLQGSIQNAIAAAYRKENPKITRFYNNVNYNEVPLWAIFEILTMGDFGYLLSCLTIDMREKVSRAIGINLSSDTYRELLYKYVYALKDLRNAIAHNDVVYENGPFKTNETMPDFRNGDAIHKFQNNRRLHHPYLLLLKITESPRKCPHPLSIKFRSILLILYLISIHTSFLNALLFFRM